MTKKHYRKIARIMAEARLFNNIAFQPWTEARKEMSSQWKYIQRELCEFFAAENPNFNAKLFDAACREEIE